MKPKKGYVVRDYFCQKKNCFVPFSGNGMKICRLLELGQCPTAEKKMKNNHEV